MTRKNDSNVEPTNVVQETKDYEQFKFLEDNREPFGPHLKRLADGIAANPRLLRAQPVLVNEKMEIIDGQHRFLCAQELGLPIFYTMVRGLTIEDARKMNMLHRNWIPNDFARSYAIEGRKSYQRYLQLQDDYGFRFVVLLDYISLTGNNKGATSKFRRGELEIPDEAKTRKLLDMLCDTAQYTNRIIDLQYDKAMLRAFNNPQYDHERMLKKLAILGSGLQSYNHLSDYLRAIEDVYNHGYSEPNRIRFY